MAKIKNQLQISVSNGSFEDEGDGLVSFPNGLTITDDSVMRSGTRYDIESLEISKYGGQLTADHEDTLGTLIGKVEGVEKEANRVSVKSIQYAIKENPYARLAYDLLVGGFSNSFSIETIGNYPTDSRDPVFKDHELVGLSQVVVPNNYNAVANGFKEAVCNSLESAKQDGLDVEKLENELLDSEAPEDDPETPENEPETPEDKPKCSGDEAEDSKEELKAPEASVEKEPEDEPGDEPEDDPETSEEPAEEYPKKTDEPAKKAENSKTENKINKKEEKLEMTPEQISEIIANAIKPLSEELSATKELAQSALDVQAKEPEFKEVENDLEKDSERTTLVKQLQSAVLSERYHNIQASQKLVELNKKQLNSLKEAGVVSNSLTLEDLGNFVIGPELYNQIATARNNYSALLDATEWRESDSPRYGWLTRGSDIDMKNVALGAFGDVSSPDTSKKRMKPVSEPGYKAHTDTMEEMAAVCPLPISTIDFGAADILDDVAAGFRSDFDRKRAQLVVARMQQAVDATGNKQTFDISEGLEGWTMVVARAADHTSVGTLVMSNKTLALLRNQAIKTQNAAVLAEIATGTLLGTPFLAVPNDLLPTLNSAETRKFSVNGTDVTVNSAVFYADLSTFTGRTHGGLRYEVSGDASYEINGQFRSAFQCNELLIRGSFYRGGVVRDETVVASIPAVAVS